MLPTIPALRWTIRLGLYIATFGWGLSFFFLFSSWNDSELSLRQMGADPIMYQPLLDYWLKMAAAVFGCISVVCLLSAFWPARFLTIIVLLIPFHFFVGGCLVVAALRNELAFKEHPTFIPDITFCFCVALLLAIPLLHTWRTRRTSRRKEEI
jgi:hypothetical protein